MEISLNDLSPSEIYYNITQTLIPRPIAWVLSENSSGSYNLAPFSYFTAVSSSPPLIMISVGKRPDGSHKDTSFNIDKRGHFVVHIASYSQMKDLNESSASLPPEESEFEMLGMKTVPFKGFPLPRIDICPIAYGCELYEIKDIGDAPQSLIFGEIKTLYIDDGVCTKDAKGRAKADAEKIDPLVRLGANEYSRLTDVTVLSRPK